MSRVRENVHLLKLLLDLAFLFCGLLKQVNTAVEGKTIGEIFAHFSVSVILFSGCPKILTLIAFIKALFIWRKVVPSKRATLLAESTLPSIYMSPSQELTVSVLIISASLSWTAL